MEAGGFKGVEIAAELRARDAERELHGRECVRALELERHGTVAAVEREALSPEWFLASARWSA